MAARARAEVEANWDMAAITASSSRDTLMSPALSELIYRTYVRVGALAIGLGRLPYTHQYHYLYFFYSVLAILRACRIISSRLEAIQGD